MGKLNKSFQVFYLFAAAVLLFIFGQDCFGAYCSASGGCDEYDEYIEDLHIYDFSSTNSGCDGYDDGTIAFPDIHLKRGQSCQVTLYNPNGYSGDEAGIWIDWNFDEVFNTSDEQIILSGGPYRFYGTVDVPSDATLGETRLRARVNYGSPSPCGITTYGEVYDKTLVIEDADDEQIIFESATMGSMGQLSGYGITTEDYLGVRFEITEPTEITHIGGHFLADPGNPQIEFFIVPLSGPTDFPNYSIYPVPSESFVWAIGNGPETSMDYRGMMMSSATLQPGWYAMVVRLDDEETGLTGYMPFEGQTEIGSPSFIARDTGGWGDVPLSSGPVRFVIEGKLVPTGPKIYGKCWNDIDDDGVIDVGENSLSGWTVFLDENHDGVIDTNDIVTTTDNEGYYEFTGIDPCEYYYVSEICEEGWINRSPGAGIAFRLKVDDGNDVEANFGNYQLQTGNIYGYKWHDEDGDGFWDNSEQPLAGWEIYIDEDENGQWDTGELKVTTDGQGKYYFNSSFEPGYYEVKEIPQAGWLNSYPGSNAGRFFVIDHNPNIDATDIVELDPETMIELNRFRAPHNKEIIGLTCFAAGPSSLYYSTFRIVECTGPFECELLHELWELDPHTGEILDYAVLDVPENHIPVSAAWMNGKLYIMLGRNQLEESSLARWDTQTRQIESIIDLAEPMGDGLAANPYTNQLLANYITQWYYYIDPVTGAISEKKNHSYFIGIYLTMFDGILYSTFRRTDDPIQVYNYYDGTKVEEIDAPGPLRIEALAAGPGIKDGHRVWIGMQDIRADFGNVEDGTASISGVKYLDENMNNEKDANEQGLGGWTIYLDENANHRLDNGELHTVTDSNGEYTFTNLPKQEYIVREIQNDGYAAIEPVIKAARTIEVNQPRDMVFDKKRNMLYISTGEGLIQRYDLATMQLLEPVSVGQMLNGMDISPDDYFLYVAERANLGANDIVRKIDLRDWSVTDLNCPRVDDEIGCWDIKIAVNGIGFVTKENENIYGTSTLYRLDISDDSIVPVLDVMGSSKINNMTRMARPVDRSSIWLLVDSSIVIYDASSNVFAAKHYTGSLWESPFSLNRTGTMAAFKDDVSNTLKVVDPEFNEIMYFEQDPGYSCVLLDPARPWLYQFRGVLLVWDVSKWQLCSYYDPITFDETGDYDDEGQYIPFERGQAVISDDGSYMVFINFNRIFIFANEHRLNTIAGREITGIDFGNYQKLCGDIDGDFSVDYSDLIMLCDDWLGTKCKSDVASDNKKVDMLDFSTFSSSWTSQPGDSNWDWRCDVWPEGGDGQVGLDDIFVLASEWLKKATIYETELTGDDIVNLSDFACLATNWMYDSYHMVFDESFETGDFSGQPWEFEGNLNWTVDSNEAFDGNFSAGVACKNSYDSSILKLTKTTQDGTMSFAFRVDDYNLIFSIDGEVEFDISETNGWVRFSSPISNGEHTFRWEYASSYGSNPDNKAWIDAIKFD